jgi:predicted Zn-dependent protease
MRQLKMDHYEKPYFMAYEMKETFEHRIVAKFGAIFRSQQHQDRRLRVEVRVGSYEFDNIGKKSGDYDFSFSPGYRASQQAPIDDDPQALRNTLWLLTDQTYKGALKSYMKLKSDSVTAVDNDEWAGSFSKTKPQRYMAKSRVCVFDKDRWTRMARSASALFEEHPDIFDSRVNLNAAKEIRYLVTSEGSRLITERTLVYLNVHAHARAPDGMLLTNQFTIYAPSEPDLPQEKVLLAKVEKLITDLEALRHAPVLEPYTGPAILDGDATGVLFHEVIGHRLEGERQLDDHEGKTFKSRIGRKIIPPFLSVIDDPTRSRQEEVALNGHYRFDDEGVEAQRVVLVDKGVLKSFLTSRTPIRGFPVSNGHGRSAAGEKPRARMANTIVSSDRQVPFSNLKKLLIDQVIKQKKPYGLIIKNIVGGSTHTSSWGYQAYKGVPQLVYRVFPDGREELVRGVEIVGTPLTSINKIVSTSNRYSVFNGFCGAESGYIPVSAVAPDVLMTELELQRTIKKSQKSQVLPSPWAGRPMRSDQALSKQKKQK